MHTKIILIPFDDFVARFVPDVPASRSSSDSEAGRLKPIPLSEHGVENRDPPSSNPFRDIPRASVEKDMYESITNALAKAGFTTKFQFISTPACYTDSSESAGPEIDCGMYPNEASNPLEQQNAADNRWTMLSRVDIAIVCRTGSTDDDPFDDTRDYYEPVETAWRGFLRQILDYAQLIFQYQQRMFQFMVLFLGDMVRIVHIDRSGIFATHKFAYRDEGGLKLAHFFWNYTSLSPSERGHDPTVTRLDPRSVEAEKMRAQVKEMKYDDYIRALFADTLDERWPWWKLEVPDGEPEGQRKTRSFLVGKPHFAASGLTGQATRGYIALDASNPEGPLLYLKDVWRVIGEDLEQEGTILECLHEHKVQFIPTPICHGDLVGQETRMPTAWPGYCPEYERPMERYQHYRIVVKEVGKPLEQFEHSSELVCALWCCISAHAQAYEDAKTIHCNISTDNILLYRNSWGIWQGMLTGWKLSKRRDRPEKHGRQHSCTGTWQFMSANTLNSRDGRIRIEDELESFFHVLLDVSIRFLPHNLSRAYLPQFLYDYFDDYSIVGMERRCGITKFSAMKDGFIDISTYRDGSNHSGRLAFHFQFFPNPPTTAGITPAVKAINVVHPLDGIIKSWLSWFRAYYILPRLPKVQHRSVPRSNTAVSEEDRARAREQSTLFKLMKAKIEAKSRTKDTKGSSPTTAVQPSGVDDTPDADADARYRTALAACAENLASHAATLALLESVISNPKTAWPPQPDRIAEKKPAEDQQPLFPTNDDIRVGELVGVSSQA
ncbi:hypothetical protein C8Q79DRAFT_970731 [Trametes meyenii]|nr:hypothetical protein C8Q79DRAFT_970731 [Trametes meyenii]